MCGIVGIFDTNGTREICREILADMNESQHHRGPDEGGLHIELGLGLGHRRLSIIDLSSGQQPFFNRDNTVVVTFNGEIYNFKDVRRSLESMGYNFKSHCDTEVIVYAWEAWGKECVNYFRGMFAFAIWDRPAQTLFLARDRLGVKPLYYSFLPDGCFIFSSELKALQRHPKLQKNINSHAVEEYFSYGYIPDPKTIYKDVYKLQPGFRLTLRRGQTVQPSEQYWDVKFETDNTVSEQTAQNELIQRLREAVDIRRISDVPIGAFLSGGVDSSAIVAMMAGLSKEPVNTCSISFGDPRFNESSYARLVADRYHTNHRVEQVNSDDFSLIDKLVSLYDEPFADSSALPTYRVCELARKYVTVALSGDGGDENLGGYQRYRWHANEERIRNLLPVSFRRPLFEILGRSYPKAEFAPKIFRLRSTFQALARDSIEGYFHGISVMPNNTRKRAFSHALINDLQGYEGINVLLYHASNAPSQHPLSLVQYLDMKTYLPGDILTKVDRASMAVALEVRVPFLDHQLVQWISALPPDYKLNGQIGKYLLKKGLESYLPPEILYRRKMGFAIPISDWIRGPLKNKVKTSVLNPIMADSGLFNMTNLKNIFEEHISGKFDHSPALWSLLMFEAFLRQSNSSTIAVA